MASTLPRFTLRTEREILDKIEYIAKYNGRSSNKEIEQLLIQHISQFEKEHGKINLEKEN